MVFAFVGPEVIHVIEQPLGVFGDSVLKRWCAPRAMNRALGRCTVVASDVDDKSVVGNTHVIQRIDNARNLCVGVRKETSKRLHQSSCNWFVTVGVVGPRRHLLWSLSERGVFGNYAELQLALVDHVAQCVPAIVELTCKFVDPFARYMMRCVHGRSREVTKKWAIGCGRMLALHPRDCLISQIFGEVVFRFANMWSNGRCLVVYGGFPL